MGESTLDLATKLDRRAPYQPDDVLIETELARALRLSAGHVRNLRSLGDGPRFMRLGRSIRYRWSDVADWLASRTVSSTSAPSYTGEGA